MADRAGAPQAIRDGQKEFPYHLRNPAQDLQEPFVLFFLPGYQDRKNTGPGATSPDGHAVSCLETDPTSKETVIPPRMPQYRTG
jgi:hypothetical protein